MPSKSFFPKDFKTGLTFWHMWFFNFQNLVRSCQHIGGTPCTSKSILMSRLYCYFFWPLNYLSSSFLLFMGLQITYHFQNNDHSHLYLPEKKCYRMDNRTGGTRGSIVSKNWNQWRPGIALRVTQRQPAFKPITWHAKSRTTKSIPGLYCIY